MFKCVALLKRKDSLPVADFIEYYETRHAVLIQQLLPGLLEYRRNYVNTDGAFMAPKPGPLDFDVISEFWFEHRAAYDAFVARATEPETAKLIASDEENLFDRSMTRMFIVDERRSA